VYGTGVTRRAAAKPITAVRGAGGEVTVDSGAIRFVLGTKGVVTSLSRDLNANGSYEVTEQVLSGSELYMVNAFDGKEYVASRATDAALVVEESGPIRAVVKATGSLTSPDGARLIKYLVRYYAYAGTDKLDVETTVIDDRLEANADLNSIGTAGTTLAFSASALGIRWQYVADGATAYRFGGESNAVYSGTVSGEQYLLQGGQMIFEGGVDKGQPTTYSGAGTGSRAPGWMAIDSGTHRMSVLMKGFWEQFPTELAVDATTVRTGFFPARAITGGADTTVPTQSGTRYKRPNSFYFLRTGGAKTYEVRLAFPAAAQSSTQIAQLNDRYQTHELAVVATPAWYTASGVFGELNVGGDPTANSGFDASMMRDIYEPSIQNQDREATMYGWRDYGDRLRSGWALVVNGVQIPSFYNDTHVGANNFLHMFLRTGDQRWFGLGEISTRHFMDIDVHHAPRQGYWNTGGLPQPAGEIYAASHENVDHETRNQHMGHSHVSGLSSLYLLTGDKRSFEVLTEIANWWKFVTPYFFKLPFSFDASYREAERDFGWPLYVMNEYVRVTSDEAYHRNVAGQLARYMVQWWQTPRDHIGYNPATQQVQNTVVGRNDASQGTGWWTMTTMDNSNGYSAANGTNPWMAGALLGNLIRFYQQDQLFIGAGKPSAIDPPVYVDMLLQGMNYVVKNGYDPTRKIFVYSEATRAYDGGPNHLVYPLAYLNRLYNREAAAGRIAHPSWYDTRSIWGTLVAEHLQKYNSLQVGQNTQSYGFYGYEIVYPLDFFKVALE